MFVTDFADEYARWRALGDKAMAQAPDESLNTAPAPDSNSIAVIARHVGGNLTSRFTDFLSSDGEKPWRDRDGEFADGPFTRAEVEAEWNRGFDVVAGALATLGDDDLARTVTVRGVELTVHQALCRSLAHIVNHVGQIILLAKMFAGSEWRTLSIPKGKSKEYNQNPIAERAADHARLIRDRPTGR
jgi:hypothetical protein